MKTQSLKRALPLLLALCVCTTLSAQETQPAGNVVSVKLINASTERIIANASVEVRSNNGIRCRRAPCATNDLTWMGVSGADGVLRIPSCVVQSYTNIRAAGYLAVNFSEARAADGTLVIELSPDTSTAPQGMTSDVPPPPLPAGEGAWLVRLDAIRTPGDGIEIEQRSWVLTSGSDIAAGNMQVIKCFMA